MNSRDTRAKLLDAMEEVFGDDNYRIEHTRRVLGYAEGIQAEEGGADLVVTAAAILHDIGIQEAERKHGSSAGRFQEIEGPPMARAILEKMGFNAEDTRHICRIVGSHHSANDIDTLEFRIVWDADWLVNTPNIHPDADQEELAEIIAKVFKTEAGKKKARELFLHQ